MIALNPLLFGASRGFCWRLMKPALDELKKRLKDYRIAADACQIATVFTDIVKDKHTEQFSDWMNQLALDVLHDKTSDG